MLGHNAISSQAVSESPISAAAPAAPVLLRRSTMLAAIAAAWSVVTITPLFASVVLAHISTPPAAHPGRHVETAALVRSLHPEPAWDAQVARKLPVDITGVAPAEVPLFSHPYRGEFALSTWEAQTRLKLVQPFVQPVNDPPFSQAKYRGEWPTSTWGAQSRPYLIPGSEINAPPPSGEKYTGEWSLLTWEAQQRKLFAPLLLAAVDAPPIAQPGVRNGPLASHYSPPVVVPLWTQIQTTEGPAPADNPPFAMRSRQDQPIDHHWIPRALTRIGRTIHAEHPPAPPIASVRYRGEWPPLTWEAQTRPKLVPVPQAPVHAPPISLPAARYSPLASHYAPPTVAPLWGCVLTSEGPVSIPVDDPPFSSPHYRGEWPLTIWEAQTSRKLPIAVTAVPVHEPPYGIRGDRVYPRYAEYWTPAMAYQWKIIETTEAGPPTIEPTVVLWRPVWMPRRRG